MWMKSVMLSIVIVILLFEVSTVIHESAHWIMCKALRCRVIGMQVLFLAYDGKRWLLKAKGKNHCAFVANDKRKAKTIVIAGPLAELVVAICSFLFACLAQTAWLRWGLLCGAALIVLSVLYNLLPVSNRDGKMFFVKERE